MNEVAKIVEDVDVSEFGLEVDKALQMQESFMPKIEEKNGFQKIYSQIISKGLTPETSEEARELRLKLVKVRTSTDKIRKREKDFYYKAGQFIDALAKKIKDPISDMEENLLEIEEHEKRKEQERMRKLQDKRVKELSPYLEDAEDKVLNEMDEDVWKAYLKTRKDEWQKEQDLIKQEEEAEKERLRIQKLHSDRKDKLLPYWNFLDDKFKESNFGEVSDKDFNANFKSAKSKKEADDKEREKIRRENDRIAKENAKLAKEKRDREEAEAKEKKRLEDEAKKAEEERKKLEVAPVKDQMNNWVSSFELPEFPGKENEIVKEIKSKFIAYIGWSKELIEEYKK